MLKKTKRTIGILGLLSMVIGCNETKNINNKQVTPNVLLIVADDLGYADMSCTGLAKDVNTPNIDKLAENGVRFTQAYATSPICSPSRGGIITGCYHQRWGTLWYGGPGIHMEEFKTIPEVLKEKDYTTGYIGKVHYGENDSDTTQRSFPLNHGFDYYFGHTSARKHYFNHRKEIEEKFMKVKEEFEKEGQSLRQQPLWENFNQIDTIAFSTRLFGEKACEFLADHKDDNFFLQLSFNAVHNFTHQLPKEYLKENNLKGYHDWNPATEDYYEWYKKGRYPNNPEGRKQFLGQLYFLDNEIGKVMKQLKELELDDNTIVIFVSDNGGSTPIYANNYPLRGSKYLLYEGGIRVPMIISYPEKYAQGIVADNVVSAMDILPTICKETGIDSPQYADGFDISPILTQTDQSINHDTLYWHTRDESAIRIGKWKYREARNDKYAKFEMVDLELGEFLYDLEKDIGETTNLKNINSEKFNELKNALNNWISELELIQ